VGLNDHGGAYTYMMGVFMINSLDIREKLNSEVGSSFRMETSAHLVESL
jgi:hypothetical protein